MTIEELYPMWYKAKKVQVKATSLSRYAQFFNAYIHDSPIAFKDIGTMRNSDMQAFLNSLLGKNLSRSTCKFCLLVVRMIISYYYEINDEPYKIFRVKYPTINQEVKKERVSYNIRERAVLSNYIMCNSKKAMHVGVLIALYTGLRIGEVCGLKWGDIDFERGYLTVRRTVYRTTLDGKSSVYIQTPKTFCSARTLPLNDDLLRILSHWRKDDNIYITSHNLTPSEPNALRTGYIRLCKRAGVKAIKFHELRHGFASGLLQQGVDVTTISSLLGHSKVSTTLDIYTHSNDTARLAAMNMSVGGMLSR